MYVYCISTGNTLYPSLSCRSIEKSKAQDEDSNAEENSDAEDEGKYLTLGWDSVLFGSVRRAHVRRIGTAQLQQIPRPPGYMCTSAPAYLGI